MVKSGKVKFGKRLMDVIFGSSLHQIVIVEAVEFQVRREGI